MIMDYSTLHLSDFWFYKHVEKVITIIFIVTFEYVKSLREPYDFKNMIVFKLIFQSTRLHRLLTCALTVY